MAIILATFTLLFLAWAVYFYTKLDKAFSVHLKYFFELDVNLMADYSVASRYDAIELKYQFWKLYFFGVFMAPLRFLVFAAITTSLQVNAWFWMKIYGINYHNCQTVQNETFTNILHIWERFALQILLPAIGFSRYTK